ncbi:MAG TPA: mechanosensitive ion channel family protein [Pseudomonadales bacterium]
MKHVIVRLVGTLAVCLCPLVAAQETDAPPAQPVDEQDIERVIDTLEDPEARAELVGELRVLLEAEREAAAEEELPAASDILDALWRMVQDAWAAIVSIDPQQLVTSVVLSAVIVIAALLLRGLLLRLLRVVYRRVLRGHRGSENELKALAELGATAPEREVTERDEFPLGITRLINLIVGVLAVALIADTWGARVTELLETDLGARMVESALAIGLILLITVAAWHLSGLLIARLLTLATHPSDRERSRRRLQSLVPLLRSLLQGVIGVLAALLILSELGVDITPLLAGAGIIGLAVGFGAQTLVKDVISGVTILLEDSATVGDVVEVAGHAGVVEEMRVRFIRLRDLAGAVRFVPYSEVTSIINYTKDFAYHLIELRVAYREDTDEVVQVLCELTEALRAERAFGAKILDALEVLGVDQLAEHAVIVKARIKTRPGDQWSVGREFNRRLKKALEERGIEIPFPTRTLYFGQPKDGKAPPARLAIVEAPG